MSAYVCINCGAALTFDAEKADSAACTFCNVINEKAQLELQRERAEKRKIELNAASRRRFGLQVAGVIAGSVLVIGGIAFTQSSSELATKWAEVERCRSQLVNVHERQHELQTRLANAEPGPARDTELEGAENRVRVERRNYDEAASAYNAAVGTWWSRAVAKVKGQPTRAEPSTAEGW